MPIIEVKNVRGVVTAEGVFCKSCYEEDLCDPEIELIDEDTIYREEGEKIYICDDCHEKL